MIFFCFIVSHVDVIRIRILMKQIVDLLFVHHKLLEPHLVLISIFWLLLLLLLLLCYLPLLLIYFQYYCYITYKKNVMRYNLRLIRYYSHCR